MANGTGTCPELARLIHDHPLWIVAYREFPDGWHYDARMRDPASPRLVVETAGEMERQMARVEAGTWKP